MICSTILRPKIMGPARASAGGRVDAYALACLLITEFSSNEKNANECMHQADPSSKLKQQNSEEKL